jgi:hypothetical protein
VSKSQSLQEPPEIHTTVAREDDKEIRKEKMHPKEFRKCEAGSDTVFQEHKRRVKGEAVPLVGERERK